MKFNRIVPVILVVAIAAFLFVYKNYSSQDTATFDYPLDVGFTERSQPVENVDRDCTGAIVSSTLQSNVYINQEYGFQFIYPNDWRLGDNCINNGTFQLFKNEGQQSGLGFDKIEAVILPKKGIDFPEDFLTREEVKIDGQVSLREEVVLELSGKILSYRLFLPYDENKVFKITMYGAPDHLHTLDEIMDSFKWIDEKGL